MNIAPGLQPAVEAPAAALGLAQLRWLLAPQRWLLLIIAGSVLAGAALEVLPPLGDTISRCTADIDTIDRLFSSGIASLVADLARLLTITLAMLLLSPTLTLLAALAAPPLLWFTRWFPRRVLAAERSQRRAVGELNTTLAETLGGAEVIRALGRETYFAQRFRGALQATLDAYIEATRYAAVYTPLMVLLASTMTDAQRRERLGVVPQTLQLFDGSVLENLTMGDSSVTRAAVETAAMATDAHGIIQALPQGYDTPLRAGDGGALLSAGQSQLLALTRALVHQPRVLVLDDGLIVEQGPPDELVRRGGRFSALLAMEAAGWDWHSR